MLTGNCVSKKATRIGPAGGQRLFPGQESIVGGTLAGAMMVIFDHAQAGAPFAIAPLDDGIARIGRAEQERQPG